MEGVGNHNVLMIETGPFSVSKNLMEPRKTSRSELRKDAENNASDLFRIDACILGRQQKWPQCIIQMCSSLVQLDDR